MELTLKAELRAVVDSAIAAANKSLACWNRSNDLVLESQPEKANLVLEEARSHALDARTIMMGALEYMDESQRAESTEWIRRIDSMREAMTEFEA